MVERTHTNTGDNGKQAAGSYRQPLWVLLQLRDCCKASESLLRVFVQCRVSKHKDHCHPATQVNDHLAIQ
jgi:hypothetical protein